MGRLRAVSGWYHFHANCGGVRSIRDGTTYPTDQLTPASPTFGLYTLYGIYHFYCLRFSLYWLPVICLRTAANYCRTLQRSSSERLIVVSMQSLYIVIRSKCIAR